MELPIVATDAVGSRDAVVDGMTGKLTPPGDSDAFADAIAAYLHDSVLAVRHGQAGRRRVQRDFQQLPIWQALANELDRLLAERGINRPIPTSNLDHEILRAA
jgi:glycosyltransferase involved in cell wall biosynthesis